MCIRDSDLGYQIRDEVAIDMIKKAVSNIRIDSASIISTITQIVNETVISTEDNHLETADKLKMEISKIEEKKKSVLDAFFNKDISKEDMELMNKDYDNRIIELTNKITVAEKKANLSYDISTLQNDIEKRVKDIVELNKANDDFYGYLLCLLYTSF